MTDMVTCSPYALPDGNVQIAFSGGRTSAFMLHEILNANGTLPDRVVVTFQNTGREMPETLDFVQEVGSRWGVNIVWLEYRPEKPLFEVVSHNSASRDGEPFEALIRRRKYLPNQQARFCTVELKILTAKRYLSGRHKGRRKRRPNIQRQTVFDGAGIVEAKGSVHGSKQAGNRSPGGRLVGQV